MAKAFFRFLRGELNGYYITNIHNTLNKTTEDIKDFIISFHNTQFSLGEMKEEDIYNLGRFAGVALKRTSREDSSFSVRMSESHEKNGVEVSEQGLFDTKQERFDFSFALGEGDINDNATKAKRSSLVGDEQPVGYIAEGTTDLFNNDGTVKEDKILSAPPTDKAYTDFYGNKYTMFASGFYSYQLLSVELYIELFKALQVIRYNGVSLETLCKIILLVCGEDLVKISKIDTVDETHNNVYYVFDNTVEIDYKQQRLSLLEYIINLKFPQVRLVEVN